MRRAVALAALVSMTAATGAMAETWKAYTPETGPTAWYYDADYSYRDGVSGRVVVLQAIGKVNANPRLGPSAPGASDGVGNVVALDCKAQNLVLMGSYKPSAPLAIANGWRAATPKKPGDEDKLLIAAVCPTASSLPKK